MAIERKNNPKSLEMQWQVGQENGRQSWLKHLRQSAQTGEAPLSEGEHWRKNASRPQSQ